MRAGDIKDGKEVGYVSLNKVIYHPCEGCGKLRWVHFVKGKPVSTKCIKCSNNDPSSTRRDTIRKIWTGRKHTDEAKQKIREAHLGTKSSDKARKSISESLKGNKRNWRGGKTELTRAIRTMLKYDEWRKLVFERDKYTCQECGNVGNELNAHHKKAFSQILKDNKITSTSDAVNCSELWDVNNGVTLCAVRCHIKRRGNG